MAISKSLAVGAIGQILAGLDKAYTGFGEVIDSAVNGATQAKQQLKDFQTFDFDPKFKTRVISVPAAIESFQELWDTITGLFTEKFQQIVDDSTAIVDGLKHIPPRAPGEPLLQRTALILNEIHAFNSSLAGLITSVLDFTQTIDDIKQRIETLDDLFLTQGSTKTTVDISYRKRNA